MLAGVFAADFFEFLEQLLLTVGQADRSFDHDVAHEVAVGVAAHPLDALARRRKTRPDWVSAGILILAAPSRGGISISPPRAAVVKEIGISQCGSLWSRWKTVCCFMWIWT